MRIPRKKIRISFPKKILSSAVPEDLRNEYNKYSRICDYCTYAIYIVFGIGILLGIFLPNPDAIEIPMMSTAAVTVLVTLVFCIKRKSIYQNIEPYLIQEEIDKAEALRRQQSRPSKF